MHDCLVNDNDAPLPPDELGDRVSEVFDLIGALYRRGLRKLEQAEKEEESPSACAPSSSCCVATGP